MTLNAFELRTLIDLYKSELVKITDLSVNAGLGFLDDALSRKIEKRIGELEQEMIGLALKQSYR